LTVVSLAKFERLVRAVPGPERALEIAVGSDAHPFETRNIHPDLPPRVRRLYDDGYYPEATFLAYKFIETQVKKIASIKGQTGFALMMSAFDETKPKIALNALIGDSDVDEQRGYRHMFAGAQSAIRNPRGHDTELVDSPDLCLDHLALASVLLRRLDDAGLRS
jgi:uncharacterized protein (TIGR02391 family)